MNPIVTLLVSWHFIQFHQLDKIQINLANVRMSLTPVTKFPTAPANLQCFLRPSVSSVSYTGLFSALCADACGIKMGVANYYIQMLSSKMAPIMWKVVVGAVSLLRCPVDIVSGIFFSHNNRLFFVSCIAVCTEGHLCVNKNFIINTTSL